MSTEDEKEDTKVLKVHVKTHWEGGIKTTGLVRGFEVVADGQKWKYGTNTAPAPGEIFLASIGACFTATFTKCAHERALIMDAVYSDVRGTITHEMTGRERLERIDMELKVCADARYEKDLQACFEESKNRCPLTNVVLCLIEITYKFEKE
ncbi:MAG: OsmC family protein [Thermoplasmata archaeon]|nr:MAG: OsmC family protein [Thermoplasmata archaeon]